MSDEAVQSLDETPDEDDVGQTQVTPAPPPMILAVVGSYGWRRPGIVHTELQTWWSEHGGVPVRLVTGGCPAGAEQHARELAQQYGWELAIARDEEFPQLTGASMFFFIRDSSIGAERVLSWIEGTSVWHRVLRDDSRNDSPWANR